jgi:hypothetical protein
MSAEIFLRGDLDDPNQLEIAEEIRFCAQRPGQDQTARWGVVWTYDQIHKNKTPTDREAGRGLCRWMARGRESPGVAPRTRGRIKARGACSRKTLLWALAAGGILQRDVFARWSGIWLDLCFY